jgi:hypothetical protein
MNNKPPNQFDNSLAWIVISSIFLFVAFWFTFIQGNVAQGIIWFGATFALFTFFNNPSGQ